MPCSTWRRRAAGRHPACTTVPCRFAKCSCGWDKQSGALCHTRHGPLPFCTCRSWIGQVPRHQLLELHRTARYKNLEFASARFSLVNSIVTWEPLCSTFRFLSRFSRYSVAFVAVFLFSSRRHFPFPRLKRAQARVLQEWVQTIDFR